MANTSAEYKRHEPEQTILYKVLEEHTQTFFDTIAGDPDRKELPDFIRREFDKFLSCGILSEGFVRLKCDDCTHSIIVPFSCKCRGFCPSCAGRRMSERSIHLVDNVIPFVPTRHWVLSVPYELRYWMASDDELLKEVNKILCDEINNYLRKKARKRGIKGGETGIVSYLQRAGSALNLNLHFHLLAIDGIYTVDGEGEPIFHGIPGIHEHEVARVVDGVSRRVIKYLRKSGKLSLEGEEVQIDDPSRDEDLTLSHLKRASISSRIALGPRAGLRVRRIGGSFGFEEEIPKSQGYGCASKNGFSIHAATSIKAHERDRLEQLLRYLGRGPVAHDKISLDHNGNILYELKKSFDGATHVLLSPLEFIEKLASIIPPPYRHQVNYYGCLSSHSKLRPLIVSGQQAVAEPAEKKPSPGVFLEELRSGDLEEEAEKPSRYIPWAELLKRTFGIDLTVCPHCGGHVRVIAAIIRKEAIQEILGHLNLPTGPPKRATPSRTEYVYESFV
jgi:hypothetical protein